MFSVEKQTYLASMVLSKFENTTLGILDKGRGREDY